jgi:hypothetical protein
MNYSSQELLSAFDGTEAQAHHAARFLRKRADLQQFSELLKKLARNSFYSQNFLTGNCFAKEWGDIWKQKPGTAISGSERALDWFSLIIIAFADELKNHVSLKSAFTRSILKGEWMLAESILGQHQETFGPTLWGLAWYILLTEESHGTKAKHKLIETLEKKPIGKAIPIFAKFYALSADAGTPNDQFKKSLQHCFPPSASARQFLEFLFFEEPSNNLDIPEILAFSEALPIVDRYELFTRLIITGLGCDHKDATRLWRVACHISSALPDSSLRYIVESRGKDVKVTNSGESAELAQCWDAYMQGFYSDSYRIAYDLAHIRPDLLPAHELLVKSGMYLGRTDKFSGTTPVTLLWQHLLNIYSKNENTEDSLHYLHRFGRRYRIPSLTYPLGALFSLHSSECEDIRSIRCGAYALAIHGPRNFEYGHNNETNLQYLTRCQTAFPSSLSFKFFSGLCENLDNQINTVEEKIPRVRRCFFAGIAAARKSASHVTAVKLLDEFLSLQAKAAKNPLSPFAIEEARRTLVDLYRFRGEVIKMQREVVHAFQDRPLSIRRFPIRRIVDCLASNEADAACHPEYPIVIFLGSDDPHEVSFGLRKFLARRGIDRPSKFIHMPGFDPRTVAILFLRVCTPEVIDSLDSMDTLEKVENERLLLLHWISKNAPHLARMAETEQLRLTQHAQLRNVLQKIEGARVVVNVTALREAEQEHFTDAYVRFSSQRDLARSRTVEELKQALEELKRSSAPIVVIRSQERDTFLAFIAAFDEIRKAFIYSPHFGIESCLSGRIRHGFVIQHIRKPFVEQRLAVLPDSAERMSIERFWKARLGLSESADISLLMQLLFKMTEQINALAEEVRGSWLHSRTELTTSSGLFNYAFSDKQLEQIYSRVCDAMSVETFVDRIFDVLLERTRESLRTVKDQVEYTLRARLGDIVTGAAAGLPPLYSGSNLQLLRHAFAVCNQEAERSCDQMKLWFEEADATLMGDANVELVARTAIGMVEQLNPDYRGRHSVDVCNVSVKGRYFTALVHLLFFLLDNAIRHSDVSRDNFSVKVVILPVDESLELSVESQMKSNASALSGYSKIRGSLADLNRSLDPGKIVKEGGSGFAKIIAALRYEFKEKEPYVTVDCHSSKLIVSVRCSANAVII